MKRKQHFLVTKAVGSQPFALDNFCELIKDNPQSLQLYSKAISALVQTTVNLKQPQKDIQINMAFLFIMVFYSACGRRTDEVPCRTRVEIVQGLIQRFYIP